MIILKHYKQILICLLIVIIYFLHIKNTTLKNNLTDYKTKINLSEQSYKKIYNKNKELIVKQNVLEVHNKKIIDSLVKTIDFNKQKIKRPQTFIQIVTETKVDSLYIPYVVTVNDSINKEFKDSTKYYLISGVVKKDGVLINKISFPSSYSIVINNKRHKIFYYKPEILIHNNNPYVDIKDLNSITLKKQPNKLLKTSSKILIFGLGIFIGYKLTN